MKHVWAVLISLAVSASMLAWYHQLPRDGEPVICDMDVKSVSQGTDSSHNIYSVMLADGTVLRLVTHRGSESDLLLMNLRSGHQYRAVMMPTRDGTVRVVAMQAGRG